MIILTDNDSLEFIKNNVKIGMWATICCNRDMFKIETESQIEEIVDEIVNDEQYYTIGTEEELETLED